MVALVLSAHPVNLRDEPKLQANLRTKYFQSRFIECALRTDTFHVIPCGRFRVAGFGADFISVGGGGGGGGADNNNLSTENAANPAVCVDDNAASGEMIWSSFDVLKGISVVPGGAGCSFVFLGILYADFKLYSNSPANTNQAVHTVFGGNLMV